MEGIAEGKASDLSCGAVLDWSRRVLQQPGKRKIYGFGRGRGERRGKAGWERSGHSTLWGRIKSINDKVLGSALHSHLTGRVTIPHFPPCARGGARQFVPSFTSVSSIRRNWPAIRRQPFGSDFVRRGVQGVRHSNRTEVPLVRGRPAADAGDLQHDWEHQENESP